MIRLELCGMDFLTIPGSGITAERFRGQLTKELAAAPDHEVHMVALAPSPTFGAAHDGPRVRLF